MTSFFERDFGQDFNRSDENNHIGKMFTNNSHKFLNFKEKSEISHKSPITVHLIEQDIRLRARLARKLADSGFHTEIYSEISEFAAFAPKSGIILIDDANHPSGLSGMSNDLGLAGAALGIIVYCEKPNIEGVVAAMKARAVNYLSLDVSDAALAQAIHDAFRDGEKNQSHQTQVAKCGKLIANLSQRERQVLESLVEGESNKGIARLLEISPRTVEIHRMKMFSKLGVKSTASAVRIWCRANFSDAEFGYNDTALLAI